MRHATFYEKAHLRNHLINAWWRGMEENFELAVFSNHEIEEGKIVTQTIHYTAEQ
jgi:hypothetical protein